MQQSGTVSAYPKLNPASTYPSLDLGALALRARAVQTCASALPAERLEGTTVALLGLTY